MKLLIIRNLDTEKKYFECLDCVRKTYVYVNEIERDRSNFSVQDLIESSNDADNPHYACYSQNDTLMHGSSVAFYAFSLAKS